MKINEILVESQQLDEGPILNKIGTGIGKVAGGVGKAVGAVAGGIAGLGSAIKKGYQAGKSTVATGGDDAESDAAEPAAGGAAAKTKPAAGGTAPAPAAGGTAPAGDNAAPATGGAAPAPAAKTKPAAGKAASGATPAAGGEAPAAGGTVYAQVKANIDKLDKKGKQRILQALQKEVGAAPAAQTKQAPGAAPADAGAGAMDQMASQLAKGGAAKPNTMASAPVGKTNKAKPGNPNAAPAAAEPAPAATAPAPEPAAPEKAAPGATTTTPSGEKVLANPVATVGTKRATNIGQQTFDTQTGKALPGQSINAIRKKAEYGTGALGAARKRIKAGAAAPAAQESIDADRRKIMGTSTPAKVREKVSESFSLFRKR